MICGRLFSRLGWEERFDKKISRKHIKSIQAVSGQRNIKPSWARGRETWWSKEIAIHSSSPLGKEAGVGKPTNIDRTSSESCRICRTSPTRIRVEPSEELTIRPHQCAIRINERLGMSAAPYTCPRKETRRGTIIRPRGKKKTGKKAQRWQMERKDAA